MSAIFFHYPAALLLTPFELIMAGIQLKKLSRRSLGNTLKQRQAEKAPFKSIKLRG